MHSTASTMPMIKTVKADKSDQPHPIAKDLYMDYI